MPFAAFWNGRGFKKIEFSTSLITKGVFSAGLDTAFGYSCHKKHFFLIDIGNTCAFASSDFHAVKIIENLHYRWIVWSLFGIHAFIQCY